MNENTVYMQLLIVVEYKLIMVGGKLVMLIFA